MMDEDSGKPMEPMRELPLGESELERLVCG